MNPLPDNVRDFLMLMIGAPLVLGAVASFLLDQFFHWWESFHPEIASHDKLLFSVLTPPAIAELSYLALAGLGYTFLDWQGAAQAVYVGFIASVGGQFVYGAFKKLTAPKTVTNNIGTISAQGDALLGSTETRNVLVSGYTLTDADVERIRTVVNDAMFPKIGGNR